MIFKINTINCMGMYRSEDVQCVLCANDDNNYTIDLHITQTGDLIRIRQVS